MVGIARTLRRNSTDVERLLWYRIRDKQIDGFRFRRQRPIGNYVVDFVCLEAKVIIELDGAQHALQLEADGVRARFFESLGFKVLRFWNNEVIENMDGVLERIYTELHRSPATTNPTPTLPLPGEGAKTEVH